MDQRGQEPTMKQTDQDRVLADSEASVTWEEIRARLLGFVSRRVDDQEVAHDIVQDVLVRIDGSLGSLRDDERLLPWVYRLTRNAVIDHYRTAARRREEPTSDLADSIAADEIVPDAAAATRRELAECLEPMLATLRPKYRQALELTEFEGLTQVEAARVVGISVPGMKSRVQRARAQLARQYHRCCRITLDVRNAPISARPRGD